MINLRDVSFITLLALMLAVSLSYPKVFLNDEWITANQVHSLVTGDDIFHPEQRKYGDKHSEYLVYTLALPILSLPIYYLFALLGDNFRLFIIALWFTLCLFIILSTFIRTKRSNTTYLLFGLAYGVILFLFILNTYYYKPFEFERYGEVAAIVFTNHIAFALLCSITYLIFYEVFESKVYAAFGVLVIITSSSYLFWATNAKDHELCALVLSIIIYFMIKYIKSSRIEYLICSFIGVGWLGWVRPELGVSAFLTLISFIFVSSILNKSIFQAFKNILIGSISCIFGAIPLFINNYWVTKNPLIPPMKMQIAEKVTQVVITETNQTAVPQVMTKINTISLSMQKVISVIINQFSISLNKLPKAVYGIYIDPQSPAIAGIFQVSPLSTLVLALPFLILLVKPRLTIKDKNIYIFLVLLILFLNVAYGRGFDSLHTSRGSGFDIRYLSPIYLPLLILATHIFKIIQIPEEEMIKVIKRYLILLSTLPLILLLYILNYSFDVPSFTAIHSHVTWALVILLYMSIIYALWKHNFKYFIYLTGIVLLSSSLWMISVTFLFATIKFEGYHFWLPVTQKIWLEMYYRLIEPMLSP